MNILLSLLSLAVFGYMVGAFGLKYAALVTFNFTVWSVFYAFWVSNVFLPIIALPIVVYKCIFGGLQFWKIFTCLIAPLSWGAALLVVGFAAGYYQWSWLGWSINHTSHTSAFWVAIILISFQFIGSDRSKSIAEMRRMWSK
jgi:hypothetical protein